MAQTYYDANDPRNQVGRGILSGGFKKFNDELQNQLNANAQPRPTLDQLNAVNNAANAQRVYQENVPMQNVVQPTTVDTTATNRAYGMNYFKQPITPTQTTTTTPQAVPVTQRTSTVPQGASAPVGQTARFRQPSGTVITSAQPNQQYLTAQGEALTNQEFQNTFGAPQPITTPALPVDNTVQQLSSEGIKTFDTTGSRMETGALGFQPGQQVRVLNGADSGYVGGVRTATYDPATGKTTLTTLPGTAAAYESPFEKNLTDVTQQGINRFQQEQIAKAKADAENAKNLALAKEAEAQANIGIPGHVSAAQTSAGASALNAQTTKNTSLTKKDQIELQGVIAKEKTVDNAVGAILKSDKLTDVQKQSGIAQLTTKPGEVFVPGGAPKKTVKHWFRPNEPATEGTAGFNKPAGGIYEGATATGPSGQKLVYKNGSWVSQ